MFDATARPIYPRVGDPVAIFWRLGGPQGWPGRVWEISPPTGIRSPNRAACESVYRLSYTGPQNVLCSRMCCDVLLLSITFTKVWKGRNGTKRKRRRAMHFFCFLSTRIPPLIFGLDQIILNSSFFLFFLRSSCILAFSLCVLLCILLLRHRRLPNHESIKITKSE